MGPFDVEADLEPPALVGGGVVGAAVLVYLLETRRGGQAVGRVEGGQVTGDIGLVVGINDGNGLAAAIPLDGAPVEGDLIEAISLADLAGAIARGQTGATGGQRRPCRHQVSPWSNAQEIAERSS